MDTQSGAKTASNKSFLQQYSLALVGVAVLIIFLVCVYYLYVYVNNKNQASVVMPAGINYTGPQGEAATPTVVVPTVDMATIGQSGKWSLAGGKNFRYTFQYPDELKVNYFPGDPSDKIAWWTGIVPPEKNIVFNVETLSALDPKYVGQPEQFVRNYWKKFGGLAGLKSVETFTNEKNLVGYKAQYVDRSGKVPATYYFFMVPGDNDHILEAINGMLPQDIFLKIVNSVEFKQ